MKSTQLINGKLEIIETQKPFLVSKGAIVKILGCSICGSDIIKIKNGDGIIGHEVVGVIDKINITPSLRAKCGNPKKTFKKGDRVAIAHHVPCFKCIYCKNKNYSMCKHFKRTNLFPGGFSDYVFVSEEHLNHTVFKIPDNITDEQASFMEPFACCLRAVERAGVKSGDHVLISGLGSIGLLMGIAVKLAGANVIGCDVLEARVEFAKKFLDCHVVITSRNDEKKAVKNIKIKTGHAGTDVVFLCSGNSSAVDFGVQCVRDGGTICIFSGIKDNIKTFRNNDIYNRELTVLGSYSPSCEDLEKSFNLIKNKTVQFDNMLTNYSLDKLEKAIDDTLTNKILKAYIKIL